MPDWFEKLVGFKEENPTQVRSRLILQGDQLRSLENDRTFQCGTLQIPRLSELREAEWLRPDPHTTGLRVREVVGDVQLFHVMPQNAGALFCFFCVIG